MRRIHYWAKVGDQLTALSMRSSMQVDSAQSFCGCNTWQRTRIFPLFRLHCPKNINTLLPVHLDSWQG